MKVYVITLSFRDCNKYRMASIHKQFEAVCSSYEKAVEYINRKIDSIRNNFAIVNSNEINEDDLYKVWTDEGLEENEFEYVVQEVKDFDKTIFLKCGISILQYEYRIESIEII